MSNQIGIQQKEYKMAVVGVLSLVTLVFIAWQWVITVRELDTLSGDLGRYKFLRPHTDGEDLGGASVPKDIKKK